jgi:hypothetical protein
MVVRSSRLILIGYWSGDWPNPESFVDHSWDPEERDVIAMYLSGGLIVRTYMGYSKCRFCGKQNGDVELSDGVFVWPEGLSHYVETHAIRLPDRFVTHALGNIDSLESADRDEEWWKSLR